VDGVHVAPTVQAYILSLVRATRDLAKPVTGRARHVSYGASPRASLALYQSAKALAWLRGQDFVAPSLVQELAADVLRHRIGLTYEAEAENLTPDTIVAQVVAQTPMPTGAK
jgi:MoxR-like ATPase